jgi:twitching motility protein PilT
MDLELLLKDMAKRQVSDLHIRIGGPPVYRINGKLFRLQMDKVTPDIMQKFLDCLMDEEKWAKFKKSKELDFAKGFKGIGRFRINAFQQRGSPALAIRSVATDVPSFEILGLPEVIRDLSLKKRGLVLVTGTTGSGKSTTLAAMVDHINEHLAVNIITIEDPIEFIHRDKRSIVSQRELGDDTHKFSNALRAAMRQDPDVILIGEIRDYETMDIALTAANTGHLVMSTLHTMSVVESISRVVAFYPTHAHNQVRLLLSSSLIAVVSLRLLPRKDEKGRVPACEILVNNAHIRELLLEPDNNSQIMAAVQEGYVKYGSQSFDQSILRLLQDEKISYENALRFASNPDDFELKVKGVEGTSDRSWTGV